MFDAADLVTLPVPATESSRKASIAQGKYGGARRDPAPNGGTLAEAERTRGLVSEAEAVSPYDVKRKACYVVEACAMGGDSIAVAMSDGRLCHAELSDKADLGPQEEQRPAWSSWRSKHGSVLSLKFSQAHDALVTLEVRLSRTKQTLKPTLMSAVSAVVITCSLVITHKSLHQP